MRRRQPLPVRKQQPGDAHTYKLIDLVGSSHQGIQPAIENALHRAAETLKGLDWFEVKEIRGTMKDGKPDWYQVEVRVGFRVLDPEELKRA
jgi:flavin-binding protein dodecin